MKIKKHVKQGRSKIIKTTWEWYQIQDSRRLEVGWERE